MGRGPFAYLLCSERKAHLKYLRKCHLCGEIQKTYLWFLYSRKNVLHPLYFQLILCMEKMGEGEEKQLILLEANKTVKFLSQDCSQVLSFSHLLACYHELLVPQT